MPKSIPNHDALLDGLLTDDDTDDLEFPDEYAVDAEEDDEAGDY